MTEIALTQILILFIQCLIVGSVLLFLFRLRSYLGLSLLFTALGVFQYMQVFLVSTIYIEVVPNVMVSPGSMVMFTGSLFAILLVYIREDALKTRKVIYAILAANIVLALLHFIFNWAIDGKYVKLLFKIPEDFFTINARILLVGTLLLILDAFLIIYLYDVISRFIKTLFFRILIVMAVVLSIDTILFSIGAFAGTGQLKTSLISGFIGKLSSSVLYSAIFSVYLIYFDKGFVKRVPSSRPFKDVFSLLDYRRKFEEIHTEHELKKEELFQREIEYRKLFESMAQGVTYQNSDGEIIDANPAALKILGLTMDQIKGKTSMDPNWRSVHEDGTDFPGNEHPSMVALRTGKEVANVVMGVYNLTNQHYRWININAIPQFLEGSIEPYQVFTTFEDITGLKNAEQKLIKQKNELLTLLNVSELLNRNLDIEKIMQTATDNLSKLLGENNSAIYLVQGSELFLSATTPKLSEEMPDSLRRAKVKEHPHIKKAIDEKSIVTLEIKDGVELTPQEKEIVEIRELKCVIYIPIVINQDVIAVLIWGSKSNIDFDEPLLGLCSTLVNQIAISIQNSNLIYDLEKELTERKIAEEQLIISENRYRALFNNASFGIIVCELIRDDQGKIIDYIHLQANRSLTTHTGLLEEDVIGKRCSDVISSEETKLFIEMLTKVLETGSPYSYQQTFPTLGRTIEHRPFMIEDDFFSISFFDITERKKAEDERDRLFETSLDMIGTAGLNGYFVQLNPSWEKTLGWTNDEFKSKHFIEFVHPDDRTQTDKAAEDLTKGIPLSQFENRTITKNGDYKWLSWNIWPLPEEGLIYCIARDITDNKETQIKIKESEEKFSKIFQNSPVAIILTRLDDGKVIEANNAIFEITGFKPQEFIGSKTTQINVWKNPKDRENYIKILLEKGRVYGYETEFLLKSGETRICRVYGELIKIKNEDYIMGIIKDINEEKLQEIEIREYQESLKELTSELTLIEERQKKEIAENIHDHLSQSLVISKMKLNELEQEDELKKYIDEIKFLKLHITEALDNSRKISNELSPPVLYQLGIVDTMYWLVHKVKNQYQLEVDFTTNVDSIELTNTELVFIYRSIQELITNAVKHANASLLKIDFKSSTSVFDIEISDNGKGFDSSNLKHRFIKSSGFGLFAVKERIQNLNGTFSIKSSPRKGTKIFISIPLNLTSL